ncbi:hypothetical protein [Methylacidimicrobium tartarophylax]|uniref:Polysaccharide chain length determinant N-terminal domain-containing protein n=1 Tax=Methylacidimicrobium tartarophylax TaxID=1041768 RepID=A0A5E6MDS6_9BACT|nr:hypothetical protein [Methylacidimicrobium tartarophylax]VVM06486.1 hypothetical protein MAMT_01227 [Methylacidimicrobium tartarophylax]
MDEIQPRPRESLGPLASGTPGPAESFEEEGGWESVRSLLSDVNRYRGAALTFFASVFVLTVVATFTQKPVYEAAAVMKIGTGAGNSILPYRQVGDESANAFEYDTFYKTELEILKSRGLAARVSSGSIWRSTRTGSASSQAGCRRPGKPRRMGRSTRLP